MIHMMRNHQICKMLNLINQIFKVWKVYFKRIAIHRRIITQMHKLTSTQMRGVNCRTKSSKRSLQTDSVRSSDEVISTFNKLSLTCSRFSTLLKRRSHYLLPRVHLQFSSEDLKKADKYNGKIKAGVRKIVKFFGEFCGASLFISEVIKDKKWKSACFFWNLRNTQCTIFVISIGKALKLVLLIPLQSLILMIAIAMITLPILVMRRSFGF